MKKVKVFLSGKIGLLSFTEMNGWRENIKNKLLVESQYYNCDVEVINPVDYYNTLEDRHQTENEVMNFDLNHVISSDIIIVNLDGLNSSDGTKIEIFQAYYNHRIPVIAFGDKELFYNLHPWQQMCITRVESDIDSAIAYVRDYYMR